MLHNPMHFHSFANRSTSALNQHHHPASVSVLGLNRSVQFQQQASAPNPTSPPRFNLSLSALISRNKPRRSSREGPTNPSSPTPDERPMPSAPAQPDDQRTKTSSSYFPVLRRMQSRRKDRENANGLLASQSNNPNQQPSTSTSSASPLRLPRNRRSLSQPPPIPSIFGSATDRLPSQRLSPSIPVPANQHPLSSSNPIPTTTSTPTPAAIAHFRNNNTTVADLTAMVPDPTTSPAVLSQQTAFTPTLSAPEVQTNTTSVTNHEAPITAANAQLFSIRFVPHLDATRSLHFEPIERKIPISTSLKIGRFTDRSVPNQDTSDHRIAFKSKVVSRGHADIFTDSNGNFFIKDTKSSSGTFLNHIRLSSPGGESKPFPLRDGDVLQLGVDYQGGTEEIYRCVKMRVELNRGWQRSANNFNQQALAQLRALGGDAQPATVEKTATQTGAKPQAPTKSISDCCICLFGVTVCQALFIAPCSHVYHFKCIRPLLQMHHPGFSCPLCRTFADLEADVETEDSSAPIPPSAAPVSATIDLVEPTMAVPATSVAQMAPNELAALEGGDDQVLLRGSSPSGRAMMNSPPTMDLQQTSIGDEDVVMEDRTFYTDRPPVLTESTDPTTSISATVATAHASSLSRQDTLHNNFNPRYILTPSTASAPPTADGNADQGSSNGVGRVFPNFSKPLGTSVSKHQEVDDNDGGDDGLGDARRTGSAGSSNSAPLNHRH